MKLAIAVLAAFTLAPTLAHADDPTAAAAAYRQAEELAKQNRWAEACPLYDASYRADAQIGVLLHLADCHEHVGRLATAAAEFADAAELAHRKADTREAYAQGRADALAPKLAHLHITPPELPIPGLAVHRDGTDITVLVGTDMPIDPGDHVITAAAPGRIEWRTKLTIGTLPTATPLAIPPLEIAPVTPEPPPTTPPPLPEIHDGALRVTTRADAHIFLEAREVGTGHYETQLRPGGYTLRVVAPGMRVYQSEITIGDGEQRAIDVPLEAEVVAPPPPPPEGPDFELGASVAPGVKLHGDHPIEIAYRAELAIRRGRRVNFGLFVEYGSIDPSSGRGACGSDLPGALPGSPFDFGAHNQFTSCTYVMPGIQWYAHLRPTSRIDPYIGLAPGFRFTFLRWTPYDAAGAKQAAMSDTWPGIVADVRVGVDYHPSARVRGWQVGALVSAEITAYGAEASKGDGVTYVSMFGGLRSTIQF